MIKTMYNVLIKVEFMNKDNYIETKNLYYESSDDKDKAIKTVDGYFDNKETLKNIVKVFGSDYIEGIVTECDYNKEEVILDTIVFL
jgi:hypothetical protein